MYRRRTTSTYRRGRAARGGTFRKYGAYRRKGITAYKGYGKYRKRRYVRGYGDYYSGGKMIKSSSNFAPDYGSRLGATLGEGIQGIARVLGFGDYRVKKNDLLEMRSNDPPMVKNIKKGEATVIQHREYIGDIFSSGTTGANGSQFNLQSFSLNPGLPGTFPWLAQLAPAFQEYEFNGIIFEFKSMSSDAVIGTNANGALGSVIMATQYNAGLPNFTNKQEMLESEYSSDCKPSCSVIHPIECARGLTPISHLYIRSGNVPTGQSQQLFDLGNFQIATNGMQAGNAMVGELWCSYTVSLYKPILDIQGGDIELLDKYQMVGCTGSAPLGTSRTTVLGSNLGTTVNAGGNIITFPSYVTSGTYLFNYRWTMGGTGGVNFLVPTSTFSAGTNFEVCWTSNNTFDFFQNSQVPLNGSAGTLSAMNSYIVNISEQATLPVVVTLSTTGNIPIGNGDLIITKIPDITT